MSRDPLPHPYFTLTLTLTLTLSPSSSPSPSQVVLDAEAWVMALPRTIEAVFLIKVRLSY